MPKLVGKDNKTLAFLRDRFGARDEAREVPGGASFAHAIGWAIVFLIVLECITGAALAAFYSPSTTQAWGSVAYIQDREPWGWLVRGIHLHAGGAIAVACGLHLLAAALVGAYRKPRELTWWVGIALMMVTLGWAVTGLILPWDQNGYWSNQVEVGIAAGAPLVGGKIRGLALGGNEYGNLTLTRFYMLHVIAMPAVVFGIIALHVRLARKHGPTPIRTRLPAAPRWPDQALRNAILMAVAFAIVVGYTLSQDGAPLYAPADPSRAFDARPLWYFRWLYELRHLAGSAEELAALAAPAVAGGLLFALPLFDRDGTQRARARAAFGAVCALGAIVTALTLISVARDSGDQVHADAIAKAEMQASRARALATKYGIPPTGALDVFKTPPMYAARAIYAAKCADCHDAAKPDRTGPVIGIGHMNRAWLKAFLKDPSGPAFYGKTKLGKTDNAMKPVELPPDDLEDLVEAVYAQDGAPDIDKAKRERGAKLFEKACSDCHTLDQGVAAGSGPNLHGHGSRDYLISFIGNPKGPLHMGGDAEMPAFEGELTLVERDAVAQYLLWLRTASQTDLDALGPL